MATKIKTAEILSELACESLANVKKAKTSKPVGDPAPFIAEFKRTEEIARRFGVSLHLGDALEALF